MPSVTLHCCRLDDLTSLELGGKDATSFLQAQLGTNMLALAPDRAPLSSWHDARGRVRALLRLVPLDGAWLLQLPSSTASMMLAKLPVYILRADVRLSALERFETVAIVGESMTWVQQHFPELEADDNALALNHGVRCLRIGPELLRLFGPSEALAALCGGLDTAPPARAELAEIELGLPALGAVSAERYLPQMLNLDRLGALSFDKGCYPGQEVIARAHHLGAVKRRVRRFRAEPGHPIEIGTELTTSQGTTVGEVLRSATLDARTELLAVVQLSALDQALTAAGAALTELPLPY